MTIHIKLSQAFKQGRRIGLSDRLSIKKNLMKAHEHGKSYKRIAAAAQIAANIHKSKLAVHNYYKNLARKARYLGHLKEKGEYTTKLPPEALKAYKQEARA
jgi:phosphoribosylaminoimidazole carboxylase (NCAIR synthetase)